MAIRQQGHRKEKSSDERMFCFRLWNLPNDIDWKQLKDLIRSMASPMWTDVSIDPNDSKNRYGDCRIRGRAEADHLYASLRDYCWNGHRLVVNVWEITDERSARQIHSNTLEPNFAGDSTSNPPSAGGGVCWSPAISPVQVNSESSRAIAVMTQIPLSNDVPWFRPIRAGSAQSADAGNGGVDHSIKSLGRSPETKVVQTEPERPLIVNGSRRQ